MARTPTRSARNRVDRVVRVRLREAISFPDLSERRALKLSALPHYTARAHFGMWHRRMGRPDFERLSGIFTPLFFVDIGTTDLPLDPMQPVQVRGETFLAKTMDSLGAIDHIVREGRYTIQVSRDGVSETVVGRARLINVFTRYDPDPGRRRVSALPPEMGLGTVPPSRLSELPTVESLVPAARAADWAERETRVWHYEQTDPNRHVHGMEYLRLMQCYVADILHHCGHDLRRLYFSRARMLYRKPCFRGEGYRRAAWLRSEAPLVITGAYFNAGDPPTAQPAVAVELTASQHDAAD